MRTLFLCIIVLGLFLSSTYTHAGTRIIGGQLARVGEFPWQAAIYVDTADGRYFCGGSLIASQWILTAAHCIYIARLYTIYLGSTTLQSSDPNRLTLSSSTGVIFPQFNQDTLEHDLGLIKLHLPVTFNDYIKPISIGDIGTIVDGGVATISGWGQTSDASASISNNLYYTDVVIISNVECKKTYGDQIKDTMICTAGNYNEGICLGDTGGALVIKNGEDEYLQIGVAGFYSQEGCETIHPSGYVRLDVYKSWILNKTEIL